MTVPSNLNSTHFSSIAPTKATEKLIAAATNLKLD